MKSVIKFHYIVVGMSDRLIINMSHSFWRVSNSGSDSLSSCNNSSFCFSIRFFKFYIRLLQVFQYYLSLICYATLSYLQASTDVNLKFPNHTNHTNFRFVVKQAKTSKPRKMLADLFPSIYPQGLHFADHLGHLRRTTRHTSARSQVQDKMGTFLLYDSILDIRQHFMYKFRYTTAFINTVR